MMTGKLKMTGWLLALQLALANMGQTVERGSNSQSRIAIWGSSVAFGVGDESMSGGFTGRLGNLLEPEHWVVLDQSHPGDNTRTLAARFEPGSSSSPGTRYLTDARPEYVVVALSLGNEGIAQCQLGQTLGCSSDLTESEQVVERFRNGLQGLIAKLRAEGMTPIVTLPYARLDFVERQYAYTRQMGLLINSWNVPSVNLLGALDDGQGRWARGFWADPFHPNSAGYTEMTHAFVPTLFAALEAGKPIPLKSTNHGHASVRRNRSAPLTLKTEDTMRSFAMSFQVRVSKAGVLASVGGQGLEQSFTPFRRSYGDFEWDTETSVLTPLGERFETTLSVGDGMLTYRGANDHAVSSSVGATDDGWHWVTITHYVVRGETQLYLDGDLVGAIAERLQPDTLVLGGSEGRLKGRKSAAADYRDWMVHRSGLTADEVTALHQGLLLQASLELYAPLKTDANNVAQSLSTVLVDHSAVSFPR
jgi:lysophospholipase L1-like esterase